MNKLIGQKKEKMKMKEKSVKETQENRVEEMESYHETSLMDRIEKNKKYTMKRCCSPMKLKKISLLANDYLMSGLKSGGFRNLQELLDALLTHENY